jgi:hypothetical protein
LALGSIFFRSQSGISARQLRYNCHISLRHLGT